MAFYLVGKRQSVPLAGTTDTLIYPGDIFEFYLVPSRSINKYNAYMALLDAFKVKNDHSSLVIHYLKLDTNLVTVQCSIAPPEKTSYSSRVAAVAAISPLTAAVIIVVCVSVVAAVWGFTVYHRDEIAYQRWLKTGSLSLSAVKCDDEACTYPHSCNAPFSVDGISGITPLTIKELDVGDYTVTWGAVADYQTPRSSKVTVVVGKTTTVPVGKYYKEGVTPPDTGWLIIDTSPVKGVVYINGIEEGIAPLSKEVRVDDYTVSFGDVEGWDTPASQTVTVPPGESIHVDGTYTRPEEEEGLPAWAKGAIGVGAAVLIGGIGVKIARSKGVIK